MAQRTTPGAPLAFLERAITYEGTECLLWPYGTDSHGYGKIRIGGRHQPAHRVVLERVAGPPPSPNSDAAHAPVICHERACVNPTHLRWATRAENLADRAKDGTLVRGTTNGIAKLTEDQVRSIRADTRTSRAVAADFGTSARNVRFIRSGQRWGWLD